MKKSSPKSFFRDNSRKDLWPIFATIFAIVVLVCGVGFGIYRIVQGSHAKLSDFDLIRYTYGGAGFGTEAMCADIIVSVDGGGNVELTNDYNSSYKDHYKISSSEYLALADYIKAHIGIFSVEDRGNANVLDGSSDYILVKTQSGEEYKTGGYAVNDSEFNQMEARIIEAVGEDRFRAYTDKIHSLD